jgi:hypothetical protein
LLPRTVGGLIRKPARTRHIRYWNAACSTKQRASDRERSLYPCSVLVPIRSRVAMWVSQSPVAIRGFVRGGSG